MRTLVAILPLVALLCWLNPAPLDLSAHAWQAGMKTTTGVNPMEAAIDQEVARRQATTEATADTLGRTLIDQFGEHLLSRSATLEAPVLR